MKRVCIQVGHYKIEEITSESLRSWRSPELLKRSTGASGERVYHWDKVMPLLRDKLIDAGVAVHIATAIYEPWTYNQEYDLWISMHYDGGGTGERCMVSAPNRNTSPAYLNPGAQNESERFAQIWKNTYPDIVGVPNRDDIITAGMRDYYAFDYVGYDTPSVILEHFNHSSSRGTYLKEHPELVAEGDFKAIAKFLSIPTEPPVTSDRYQVIYKGEVLQEYEINPTDTIQKQASDLEQCLSQVATLTDKIGTLQADLRDAESTLATCEADLTTAQRERDDAKAAVSAAEKTVKSLEAEITLLNEKINKLESTSPCDAYTGMQLIRKGLAKIFKKRG